MLLKHMEIIIDLLKILVLFIGKHLRRDEKELDSHCKKTKIQI